MVRFRPVEQIKPVVPPRGHFFFAGRTYKRVQWWKNARMRTLYFWVVILVLTNTANGFDGSMMNGLQALPYWQDFFDSPRGSMLGFYNASMSLGSLIGLPFCPPLVDRFGRKVGILVGSLFLLLGVGLQAGANGFGMFVGGRFLLGFGMCITLSSAPLLIAEISHPQDRAILSTYMGCTYHSGAFIAAWTTYGTLQIPSNLAWRLPSALQCICTIIILAFLYWIPESPRWLVDKDRNEEALEILAYYHADGNKEDEFVLLEYTEIRTALAIDKQNNRSSKWVDFLKTPGNRKRIGLVSAIGLFSQWSGNGIMSYYLTFVLKGVGITSPQEQLGLNGGMKAAALFVNFFFALFVDRFGRRPIYMISTVGMLFAFTIITIISARFAISENNSLGNGLITMIFVYDFFYNFKVRLPDSRYPNPYLHTNAY
jgi:sugar porter (SP) family MFS transporter